MTGSEAVLCVRLERWLVYGA